MNRFLCILITYYKKIPKLILLVLSLLLFYAVEQLQHHYYFFIEKKWKKKNISVSQNIKHFCKAMLIDSLLYIYSKSHLSSQH